MKKAYIAGKVTGLPFDHAQAKFKAKEVELRHSGYDVINPITHIIQVGHVKRLDGWADEMKACIAIMLQCDEVHFLPCWRDSRGATLEHDVACRLGMTIVYH
jgi:Domain of unknown function (DUF4406)